MSNIVGVLSLLNEEGNSFPGPTGLKVDSLDKLFPLNVLFTEYGIISTSHLSSFTTVFGTLALIGCSDILYLPLFQKFCSETKMKQHG